MSAYSARQRDVAVVAVQAPEQCASQGVVGNGAARGGSRRLAPGEVLRRPTPRQRAGSLPLRFVEGRARQLPGDALAARTRNGRKTDRPRGNAALDRRRRLAGGERRFDRRRLGFHGPIVADPSAAGGEIWRCYPGAGPQGPEGSSSIGRAPVSKTGGWGFESLLPCSDPILTARGADMNRQTKRQMARQGRWTQDARRPRREASAPSPQDERTGPRSTSPKCAAR